MPSLVLLLACIAMSAGSVAQSSLEDDTTRRTRVLAEAPGAELSGEALEAAVALELKHDPLIDISTIDVVTDGHVITVTGTQPLLIAKERATYVAETVRGVSQVVNDIKVDAHREVDGKRLESDIHFVLLTDPATDRGNFTVEASDTGHVVLRGTVASGAERSLAENAVKSIAGVRSVVNEVEVVRAEDRSDEEIYADVMRMLQWDAYVDSADIAIVVNDGVVTLSGVVGSPAEKRRAVGLSWVAGVEHVDVAPLKVSPMQAERPAMAPRAGTPLELKSDEAIAEVVREALALDPRIDGEGIDVDVDDGRVTLTGMVGDLRAKRLATRTPYGILGVTEVRDRLRLPEARAFDDNAIRRRIQHALANNSLTNDDAIIVVVQDGKVTLEGTADTRYTRMRAEDLAAAVRGVVAIENSIDIDDDAERLAYDPYIDFDTSLDYDWSEDNSGLAGASQDGPIEQSVERELWWSPFVDESSIAVSVNDAVVTLTGTVASEAERRAAIENAFEGGAVSVRSELVVSD